jgi:transcriptional regulator with XRE-family HTH domain
MRSLNAATAFGKALRDQRKHCGLTQETLGFEAGLRRTYISSLELGEKQPTLTTIFKLASALNIPASDLIKQVEFEINTKT